MSDSGSALAQASTAPSGLNAKRWQDLEGEIVRKGAAVLTSQIVRELVRSETLQHVADAKRCPEPSNATESTAVVV